MKNKSLVLLLVLTFLSCATGTQEVVLGDLLTLEAASLNLDNATKALIILQDFRVSTIRAVKINSPERIEQIRPIDKVFKAKWTEAERHLSVWRLLSQGNANYRITYEQLLRLAIDLADGEQRWGLYHQPNGK